MIILGENTSFTENWITQFTLIIDERGILRATPGAHRFHHWLTSEKPTDIFGTENAKKHFALPPTEVPEDIRLVIEKYFENRVGVFPFLVVLCFVKNTLRTSRFLCEITVVLREPVFDAQSHHKTNITHINMQWAGRLWLLMLNYVTNLKGLSAELKGSSYYNDSVPFFYFYRMTNSVAKM